MNRNEIIGKRIVTARDLKDMQAKELAEKLGISATRLSNWENATSGINADFIFRISEILGVTSDYLLGLTDDPSEVFKTHLDSVSTLMTVRSLRRLNSQGQEKVATYADDLDKSGQYRANRSVDMSDYVETYSVASTAAGAGAYNEGHEEFYRRVSACDIPERFDAQIDITGDSMEPTIPDGAVAFVEFTLGDPPKDSEIYVFQRGEDTMIKRGFFEHDKWILRSDNPDHADITVTEYDSVRIIGRLVDWTMPV